MELLPESPKPVPSEVSITKRRPSKLKRLSKNELLTSRTSESKWSWAEPMEPLGPGSYAVNRTFDKSGEGKHITFGKSNHARNQFYDSEILRVLNKSETPAAAQYSPNIKAVRKND
jgi:hypothetical protein